MSEQETTDEPPSIQSFIATKLEEQQARNQTSKAKVSGQAEKDSVHLAGEYYVAAELHRRGIHATITYGNAKAADILAFSLDGDRFARVEVKSSRPDKGGLLVWTGNLDSFPMRENQFWVLCMVPLKGNQEASPRFWVLGTVEMYEAIQKKIEAYTLRRNGAGDSTKWMWTFSPLELDALGASGAWNKIVGFLS